MIDCAHRDGKTCRIGCFAGTPTDIECLRQCTVRLRVQTKPTQQQQTALPKPARKKTRPELHAWLAALGAAFNVRPVIRCCGCTRRKALARMYRR